MAKPDPSDLSDPANNRRHNAGADSPALTGQVGGTARLKPGLPIKTLDVSRLGSIITHPAQLRVLKRVEELISHLRQCESWSDLYEFQRHLFQAAYEVDDRRAHCVRMAKRLRAGRGLPSDTPEYPHRGDPLDPATWELEAFIYERLFRQVRSVGDALAWVSFGYDRRWILVLSRNNSPGPLVKRAGTEDDSTTGLAAELGRVIDVWNERHRFTLLHDLTNCMRIGDATEFDREGGAWLHEVKAGGGSATARQARRMQEAIDSLNTNGPLPGPDGQARVIPLSEPHRTNLGQLLDCIGLARHHGSRGMRLSNSRALVVTSLADLARRSGDDHTRGLRVIDSARRGAIRRSGLEAATHHIVGRSGDTAARSAVSVPWGIYPLPPEDCAALICDFIIFEHIVSADALRRCLNEQGLRAEIELPPMHQDISGEADVLKVTDGHKLLTVHAESLSPLLYELVAPDSWARGIAELLSTPSLPTHPVITFASETKTWWPVVEVPHIA